MKIAIGICEKTNGRCSTMGCFRAYNNREKHFSSYKDMDTELMSFFSCDICSSGGVENISKIAKRLKDSQIHILHLGACAVNCKADKLEEIKKIFTDLGIDIVEGTH